MILTTPMAARGRARTKENIRLPTDVLVSPAPGALLKERTWSKAKREGALRVLLTGRSVVSKASS